MKLEVLSAKVFARKLKATIQASGRLGFTDATSRFLGLNEKRGIKFATDEVGKLYLAVCEENSQDCFPTKISSGYYYVSTEKFFDFLHIDYRNYVVIFDLIRFDKCDNFFGGEAYKMNQRIINKRGKHEKRNKI